LGFQTSQPSDPWASRPLQITRVPYTACLLGVPMSGQVDLLHLFKISQIVAGCGEKRKRKK
jgi:hypothetical protein